ncbi:hypothetical protein KAU18_10680, partial [Candidatus Bathyarchaeota archaeon]|nr:hypothetical protein [Candidatus Bathyarchaeota archaeon]
MQSLQLFEDTLVRKERRIPTEGEVLVKPGDKVEPGTVVAKGVVKNPDIRELRIYASLGISPDMVKNYMLKTTGDDV